MPDVALNLNGRLFRFVCEPGEEEHFLAIAAYLETKVEGVRAEHGKIGEDRALAMAAVLIIDELFEVRAQLAQVEEAGKAAEARAAARRAARVGGAGSPAARPGDGTEPVPGTEGT